MNDKISNAARTLANKARLDVLEMIHNSHASHIGSAFSCAEILAVLYAGIANVFPNDPNNNDRDRIILSKGHAGSILYAILAEVGFFPVDLLKTYYKDGSYFSGHISHKNVLGVEFSTGSLGQGVCVACGLALSAKISGKNNKVIAIVGDGELEEGSIWEMALFASHNKLSNFIVIVDNNKLQAMGSCESSAGLVDIDKKWTAFGWNTLCVDDGNNTKQLVEAFCKIDFNKPNVIIANTIKGKGVSFMENNILWHYKDPQGEQYEIAKKELMEKLYA